MVTVTFKNIKTAKSTAKKYRCVVKAALEEKEPEKPVEEAKATKITEAKAASAKTISVTFDGVVDTSSATAIKVERGSTAITVTAKYASDSKSVILTSDTSLAAGTYTVTVGSMVSDPFVVVKQTPTTMKIVNTTVANQGNARVYFQVLDQYNDVMENYTDKESKITVKAYNVTKGHDIEKGNATKKDYFELDCSTETVGNAGFYLNAIGDKVSIVAYLTDNAAVSCKAELEIVRVYTNELTFGDIKLGNDKRVTEGRTYELLYTAKTNEGNDIQFDSKQVKAASGATRAIGNYNFITSNSSAVKIDDFTVNNDGNFEFVANEEGTAVITAINTVTGETSSVKIVVNKPAQLSAIEVADASVAYDAAAGTKIKAAVVAYDQFGEVIDPRNVKNTKLGTDDFDTGLFSSVSATPDESTYGISIEKITSDGKYVQYNVDRKPGKTFKGRTQTFTFVSKAMGENGYIRSTATVTIDDEIEASALEIVKAPAATAAENDSVKLQVAIKDQYQNKMEYDGEDIFKFTTSEATYDLKVKYTNSVLTGVKKIKEVPGESKVYEIKLNTNAVTNATHEPGTFTLELKEGQKVIASKTFDLTIVDTITEYTVKRDKGSYKAGDKIAVDVEAYSGKYFNKYYNGTISAQIVVSNAAVTGASSKMTKDLTFKDGVASFELTAGKEANGYEIIVTNQNAYDSNPTHKAEGISDKYNVVKNEAGKLVVNDNGKLQLTDSQGNATGAWNRNAFATIKVMDDTKNVDITGSSKITSTSGEWNKKNDNTVEVYITDGNIVTKATVGSTLEDYDMGNLVVTVPDTSKDHIILLSITINGFTWEKKVDANGSTSANFSDTGKAGNRYTAQIKALDDQTKTYNKIITQVSGAAVSTSASITATEVASGASVSIDAVATIVSGTGFTVSAVSGTGVSTIGFNVSTPSAVSAGAVVKVVYTIKASKTEGTGSAAGSYVAEDRKIVVEYTANQTNPGTGQWTGKVVEE